jgi:hypothetical protein
VASAATSHSVTSGSLATANEIVFAVTNLARFVDLTGPSGFTPLFNIQAWLNTVNFECGYKIVAATTAVTATWTHEPLPFTPAERATVITSFKFAAVAAKAQALFRRPRRFFTRPF